MKSMIDSITPKKKSKKVKLRAEKKSAVLVLTIIVISISMVISLIVSQLVTKELILARKLENSTQAFYAAQAGIEDALNRLVGNPTLRITGYGDTTLLDTSQYTIFIEDVASNVEIKSEGQANSVLRTIKIVVPPKSLESDPPFLERVISWEEVAP